MKTMLLAKKSLGEHFQVVGVAPSADLYHRGSKGAG